MNAYWRAHFTRVIRETERVIRERELRKVDKR
jgi:hypothetical protein